MTEFLAVTVDKGSEALAGVALILFAAYGDEGAQRRLGIRRIPRRTKKALRTYQRRLRGRRERARVRRFIARQRSAWRRATAEQAYTL